MTLTFSITLLHLRHCHDYHHHHCRVPHRLHPGPHHHNYHHRHCLPHHKQHHHRHGHRHVIVFIAPRCYHNRHRHLSPIHCHDSDHQGNFRICLADSSQQNFKASVSVSVATDVTTPRSRSWRLFLRSEFVCLVLVLLFAVVFSDDVLIEHVVTVLYGRGKTVVGLLRRSGSQACATIFPR